MRSPMLLAVLILALSIVSFGQTPKETGAKIKQAIIKESIAAYKGRCPCPYNTANAGKSCGARSAYSKPRGASPLCFEKDVTQEMVDDYPKKHGL